MTQSPSYPQPAALQRVDNAWDSGCCGCCDDFETCCYGFWCLPCLYGENVAKSKHVHCFCPCLCYCLFGVCCSCVIGGSTRGQIRTKYNLPEDPCFDCLMHCPCCTSCSICQEAREIKYRGVQPSGTVGTVPPGTNMMSR